MIELALFVSLAVKIATWVVIAAAVASWLVAFGVVNPAHGFVGGALATLERLTEPLLRPIRRVLPPMGGLDLSPIVLLVGLWLLERLVWRLAGA